MSIPATMKFIVNRKIRRLLKSWGFKSLYPQKKSSNKINYLIPQLSIYLSLFCYRFKMPYPLHSLYSLRSGQGDNVLFFVSHTYKCIWYKCICLSKKYPFEWFTIYRNRITPNLKNLGILFLFLSFNLIIIVGIGNLLLIDTVPIFE